MGEAAVVAAAIVFGGVGIAFRLGRLRRLAWAYVDPGWAGSRFYANGVFAMIPGACMFGFPGMIALIDPEPGLGGLLAILSFGSAIWIFVTLIHPPKFLKPRWIREFDRAIKTAGPSADIHRFATLREIGHKVR